MGRVVCSIEGDKFIPKDKCQPRKLYRLHSRNLAIGVYREDVGGFIGIRTKFGSRFLDTEYHWDNGPPYGTVQPQEELPEDLPAEIEVRESLGTECHLCGKTVEYVGWPEGSKEITLKGGHKMVTEGRWLHMEPTDCKEPDDPRPMSKGNQLLMNWLKAMEKKYPSEE